MKFLTTVLFVLMMSVLSSQNTEIIDIVNSLRYQTVGNGNCQSFVDNTLIMTDSIFFVPSTYYGEEIYERDVQEGDIFIIPNHIGFVLDINDDMITICDQNRIINNDTQQYVDVYTISKHLLKDIKYYHPIKYSESELYQKMDSMSYTFNDIKEVMEYYSTYKRIPTVGEIEYILSKKYMGIVVNGKVVRYFKGTNGNYYLYKYTKEWIDVYCEIDKSVAKDDILNIIEQQYLTYNN